MKRILILMMVVTTMLVGACSSEEEQAAKRLRGETFRRTCARGQRRGRHVYRISDGAMLIGKVAVPITHDVTTCTLGELEED